MYKPQNVAKFRDDSSKYPKGSSTGKGGGTVPGTTGSNDRGSQPDGAELNGQFGRDDNANEQHGPDYSLIGNENNPRSNPSMGRRSYGAEQPSL